MSLQLLSTLRGALLPVGAVALALTCPLSAGTAGEAAEAAEAVCDGPNRREPASMLLFPLYDAGVRGFTMHCITNTNTTPSGFGSVGGTTDVMYEYVQVEKSGDPLHPKSCTIFDRVEQLTPADTLCVVASCHTPAGSQGYLLVTAQDPQLFKTNWSHNYLVGSELVISFLGGIYSLNAIGIQSPLAKGTATDISPADGLRQLNGVEYDAAPDKLILDSVLAIGRHDLVLVNLSGTPAANNTIRFDIWNDNELPLSSVVNFNCWFSAALPVVSPVFDQDFLANLPNDPDELDLNCNGATVETAWAILDSLGVSSQQGMVSPDGAILGALTGGLSSELQGGRLLWESCETQTDGALIQQ